MESPVLIGVLRSARDREILLRQRWYRIPCRSPIGEMPSYLAFYQSVRSGAKEPGIALYARVCSVSRHRRRALFPREQNHPRAREWYWKFSLGPVRRLPRLVRNLSRTRVSFIRASLGRLRGASEMRDLFGIPPLEEIMGRMLKREKLDFRPQFILSERGRCRYRLDFAVFAPGARIAVECDHSRWHNQPHQKKKDRRKDRWLKRRGWKVLRFDENDLVQRPKEARRKIRAAATFSRTVRGGGRNGGPIPSPRPEGRPRRSLVPRDG